MIPTHDAIVLAGGRGSRLGGVDKATVVVAGQTLLERSLTAVNSARETVFVGHSPVPEPIRRTLEYPPDGGPVAGIIAGFKMLAAGADWILVLAVDQPAADQVIPQILSAMAAAPAEVDVICTFDDEDFPQWLLAAYRRDAIEQAASTHAPGHGISMKRFTDNMNFHRIESTFAGDIDTWDDHKNWELRLS